MLLEIEDVPAVFEDETRHSVDEAGLVGAVDQQRGGVGGNRRGLSRGSFVFQWKKAAGKALRSPVRHGATSD